MSGSPPAPTFADPDANKGPTILVATGITTGAALALVCLRVYVRSFVVRNFGMDDVVICLAMTLSVVGFSVVVPEVYYGAGQHITQLTKDQILKGLELNFITQPIYVWVQTLCKISIGAFLLRLAVHRGYYWAILGIIGFLFCYTVAAFFTIVLQCRPIQRTWDRSIPGTCFSQPTLQGLSYFNAVIAVVTDFIFATLPIPMLWHIRINSRQKVAVMGILGLGFFASSACIVKSVMIKDYGKNGDFLYDSANLTIWNCVEGNVGIIAASIPTLKPLFKAVLGTTQRSYNSNGKNSNSAFQRKHSSTGYIRQGQSKDTHSGAEAGTYGMQSFGKQTAAAHPSAVTSTKISHATSSRTWSGDDDSDHFILVKGNMSSVDAEQGIMKTTQVTVVEDDADYDGRDSNRPGRRHNSNRSPVDWHTRFKD